jgi:hypothetical protein
MQHAQPGFGHDRVANPLWGDDERTVHGARGTQTGLKGDAGRSRVSHRLATLEPIHGGAVRALGFTCARDIQKHFGVGVPCGHASDGAGAKHATVSIEVRGLEFDGGGWVGHSGNPWRSKRGERKWFKTLKPVSTSGRILGCGR